MWSYLRPAPGWRGKTIACLMISIPLLSGCAAPEPDRAPLVPACPLPPQPPAAVRVYEPPETPLLQQWNDLLREVEQSLNKVTTE